MSLKFGLALPQGWTMELASIKDPVEAYEAMTRVAQTADETGFTSIWLVDHFHTIPHPSQEVTFECWTTAAALARDTKRVRVGPMVTCNEYRNPALLAKMASTVDVLSHGRLNFGIGAGGWNEQEYRAYGYDYPDAPIPLLIGGSGEKVTLKLVAQYGDACNIVGNVPTIQHKFAMLKHHCETVGRDYESIHRTVTGFCSIGETDEQARTKMPQALVSLLGNLDISALIGSPATIRMRLDELEAAGVQELILTFPDALQLDSLRFFAKESIA
jgi:alkanesulfonate monooxygenase SsuD/methylene tetrahydromethanopterin reductase-like flavin-dependent oxidoreductase (luciferase family)